MFFRVLFQAMFEESAYAPGAQEMPLELISEDEEGERGISEMDEVYEKMVDSLIEDSEFALPSYKVQESKKQEAYFPTAENEYEPASPIRTPWPADSLLKPDHFTIDTQRCLNCNANLGYAMPMNRIPKVKYLFCDHPNCQTTSFLKCWACGNFQNENTGHLVHRPGNSAYQGPSQIYSFMCHHCYQEQMQMEPSVEETKEQYRKFANLRRENEKKEFPLLEQAQRLSDGYLTKEEQKEEIPTASRKRRRVVDDVDGCEA